ncbi:MAG TPA: dihydrofolate reductase family protein [Polyangiaceae bacterium]|nr:dihydrofolate reductase family protein [Polyangiaceae bacterium]
MRKLIVSSFVSLDGVVENPQNWALALWDEENQKAALAKLSECDAFLFGRVTYEMFAVMSPSRTGEYYDTLNRFPKYVASTTLRETTWNATRIEGNVVEAVAKLKKQPGKHIIKYGVTQLDRTLLQHDLIDEFNFTVFPFAVGSGRHLFEGMDISRLKLELTDTTRFRNGLVTLSYIRK